MPTIKKIGTKKVYSYDDYKSINQWIDNYRADKKDSVGNLCKLSGCDFQKQNLVHIRSNEWSRSPHYININNLIPVCCYISSVHCVEATWLNDRDQFLYPSSGWASDKLFHSDCLAYTLFHGSNNIQSSYGVNHWIPFSESEVSPKGIFKSHFMTDFISGKLVSNENPVVTRHAVSLQQHTLLHTDTTNKPNPEPLQFSEEADKLFNCGRKLWKYYHLVAKDAENYLNDASFYDIRRYFQGESNGRMKQKSNDAKYNNLIADLRTAIKKLGDERIVEKVYLYGFLLR